MAGAKDAYQIDLSAEQIAFLRSAQEQYNIVRTSTTTVLTLTTVPQTQDQ